MSGKIVEIYLARRGETPRLVNRVEIVEGKGLVGDRYYDGEGTFSRQLTGNRKSEITFVAAEEVERFNRQQGAELGNGDLRRNVVTRGIDLNSLVGAQFTIAGIRFEGMETCEPCAHLARTVHPAVLPHLVRRAGLRAAILSSGVLAVDSEIVV